MGAGPVAGGTDVSFSSDPHFLPLPAQRPAASLLSRQALGWFYLTPRPCPDRAARGSTRGPVLVLTAAETAAAISNVFLFPFSLTRCCRVLVLVSWVWVFSPPSHSSADI